MDLFDCLIVGHLVGDFLLQNEWMAENKAKQIAPLLVHSSIYTLSLFMFSLFVKPLPWLPILLIFVSHSIVDQRGLITLWGQVVTNLKNNTWLYIMADQTVHIIIILIVCLMF